MCQTHMTRRDLLQLSALLTLTGAASSLASFEAQAKPSQDAPLQIGYLPITDAAPFLIAHHKGFFDAQGIVVEKSRLFRSWAQLVEAFISGQVNLVHLLSPMTLWARFNSKVPAKIVAWNHVNGSALTVASDVADLKGLGGGQVAIPFWYSIHNVILQDLLRSEGLVPVAKRSAALQSNEVELVVMPPSDMLAALAAKRIRGYIVAEPFNAAAELLGVGKVLRFSGDVWRDHACCTVFMHERDLTGRPDWSEGVVHAVVRAQQWIQENRAETASILSRESGHGYTPHQQKALGRVLVPDQKLNAGYISSKAIRNSSWREERLDFQPFPFPSYTETLVQKLRKTTVEGDASFLNTLDPSFAARDLVDDRFVRKAIESLGGPTRFGIDQTFARQETIKI